MRRTTCRLCGSDQLDTYLDLGIHPPSDAFTATRDEPQTYYPLDVNLCRSCGHSQLGYVVPPDILFGKDYPYEANITAAGRAHWAELATVAVRRFGAGPMVDIGGNVGALCAEFFKRDCPVTNVEPAMSVARISHESGVQTMPMFWSYEVADRLHDLHGPAAFITATNVFAHVDDLSDFCRGAKRLLHSRGVLIIEVPWLRNLLAMTEYDTIYHEHLSYITVGPLVDFFKSHGLEVFDVEPAQIHGGSIRIWVGHKGKHVVSDTVENAVMDEAKEGTADPERLERFALDVEHNRTALRRMVDGLSGTLCAVSAPAKGMTLLNYAGINVKDIAFVTEKSRLKIGRFTPGGRIPVVPDSWLFDKKPDYALLLAWNWSAEITAALKEYPGTWLLPIPHPRQLSRSSTGHVADLRSVS